MGLYHISQFVRSRLALPDSGGFDQIERVWSQRVHEKQKVRRAVRIKAARNADTIVLTGTRLPANKIFGEPMGLSEVARQSGERAAQRRVNAMRQHLNQFLEQAG